MKKIILMIIAFGAFMVPVKATEYYQKVYLRTSFKEDVVMSEVNSIIVLFDDVTDRTFDLSLEKNANYQLIINNVAVGDIDFSLAMVEHDYQFKYEVIPTITTTEANELNIDLMVQVRDVNTTKVQIDDNLWQYIEDPDNHPYPYDEPITTTKTPTTTKIQGEVEIPDVNSTSTTRTTKQDEAPTTTGVIEREQNIQKRNKIYIVLLEIIGIILFVVIIFITIKFMRANK